MAAVGDGLRPRVCRGGNLPFPAGGRGHCGRSGLFHRLAVCAWACPWCDTKHSCRRQPPTAEALGTRQTGGAERWKAGAGFVVITAENRCLHNLDGSARPGRSQPRRAHSFQLQPLPGSTFETSGVESLTASSPGYTLSPKPHSGPPTPKRWAVGHGTQVVVALASDAGFAEQMALRRFSGPEQQRELGRHAYGAAAHNPAGQREGRRWRSTS